MYYILSIAESCVPEFLLTNYKLVGYQDIDFKYILYVHVKFMNETVIWVLHVSSHFSHTILSQLNHS